MKIRKPNPLRWLWKNYGKFIRRVLLSSLEGAAVSSVKIKGAPHEYCSLDGVKEDVTESFLILKTNFLKVLPDVQVVKKSRWPGEVTAGDLILPDSLEILNPDFVICTLSDDGSFEAEMEVRIGRGYCPAELNKKENQEIGIIPVDCLFSPVRRVKYETENTRVGRQTDYDKLIIEIWTDGRVSPRTL